MADEEEVRAAAERELREETGHRAGSMTVIGRAWLAGYATTERYAAVATNCRWAGPPKPDREEFCQTTLCPRDAFLAQVRTGELKDSVKPGEPQIRVDILDSSPIFSVGLVHVLTREGIKVLGTTTSPPSQMS